MKSRSESLSGVGFDDFAKFVHIFSSLVLTELRLSFKFISTFIRMKKNYQSTFKIIFRPALSQGKLFHVENQRELVTMANLQMRKMYCLFFSRTLSFCLSLSTSHLKRLFAIPLQDIHELK